MRRIRAKLYRRSKYFASLLNVEKQALANPDANIHAIVNSVIVKHGIYSREVEGAIAYENHASRNRDVL